MIKADDYFLVGVKEDGTQEIIFPEQKDFTRRGQYIPGQEPNRIKDYAEVEKYIRSHLTNKYVKILVGKCVDLLYISIQSCLESPTLKQDIVKTKGDYD
jgi:hypothetical protein